MQVRTGKCKEVVQQVVLAGQDCAMLRAGGP